jgi:hypothetical protein
VTRLRNVPTGWAAFRAFRQIPTPEFCLPQWELEAWSVFEGRHRQHADGEALRPHLARRSHLGAQPHKTHAARLVPVSSGQVEQPASRARLLACR